MTDVVSCIIQEQLRFKAMTKYSKRRRQLGKMMGRWKEIILSLSISHRKRTKVEGVFMMPVDCRRLRPYTLPASLCFRIFSLFILDHKTILTIELTNSFCQYVIINVKGFECGKR